MRKFFLIGIAVACLCGHVLGASDGRGAGAPGLSGGGGGGSISFSALLAGTNVSATMVVGSGASIAATGTGTVTASTLTSNTANTIAPATDTTALAVTQSSNTPTAAAYDLTLLNGNHVFQIINDSGPYAGLIFGNATGVGAINIESNNAGLDMAAGGSGGSIKLHSTIGGASLFTCASTGLITILDNLRTNPANGDQNQNNAPISADALADTIFTASADTQKPLVLQAHSATQSASFFEVQASDGTKQLLFTPDPSSAGYFGFFQGAKNTEPGDNVAADGVIQRRGRSIKPRSRVNPAGVTKRPEHEV